jgi:hypothetical protein
MTDRLLTIAAWALLAFTAGYLTGHLINYVM